MFRNYSSNRMSTAIKQNCKHVYFFSIIGKKCNHANANVKSGERRIRLIILHWFRRFLSQKCLKMFVAQILRTERNERLYLIIRFIRNTMRDAIKQKSSLVESGVIIKR